MEFVTRWFREVCCPALKCRRLGHRYRQITVTGLQWPAKKRWCYVADEVTLTIHECRRCKRRTKLAHDRVLSRVGHKSVSLADNGWDLLHEHGFIHI